MWRWKKKHHLQPPSTKKNSKNILRVKKLHGWVLIRWVRTWREDGHQVRLVRLVSWDGRLARLQSRGTSRNLRQILKIGAVNLWVFQELFWLEDIFYVSVVVMCMCIYIYMSMICVYSVVSYSYIHIYHPFPTKIAIQFTKFELFSEIDHPQVLSHIFKANYRQVGHIFVCFVCENFLPLLLKTIFGSPQKNGSKQNKTASNKHKKEKEVLKIVTSFAVCCVFVPSFLNNLKNICFPGVIILPPPKLPITFSLEIRNPSKITILSYFFVST